MSDKTQILPDALQPQSAAKKESSSAKNADKKSASKKALAIGAGVVAGVGAVSWDAYATEVKEAVEETAETETSQEQSETTDSTPTSHTTDETPQPTQETHNNVNVTAIPDHLAIANMPDSMSFDEAFEAARQSMGAGALFEWRGELYHTCHPNEYAALPDEIKNLFADAWIAHESQTDGIEVVPEEEGVAYVFDLNPASEGLDQSTDTSDPVSGEEAYSDEYTAYADVNPVDADYDSNYEGADDFIHPDDMVA